MSSNSHRARLMFVTLTAARLERSLSPALELVHAWLDSWSGIGVIERGMARQGFDLQLTRYANEGWRATFYVSGREHSTTRGTAWERTPWRAVQTAAWEALASRGRILRAHCILVRLHLSRRSLGA